MPNKDAFEIFDDIHVSKELDEKILKETVYKKEPCFKIKKLNYALMLIIVLTITLLGVGVAYATKIVEHFRLTIEESETSKFDQLKISLLQRTQISPTATLSTSKKQSLSFVENDLGIKLLGYTAADELIFDFVDVTKSSDNKITSVKLSDVENDFTLKNAKIKNSSITLTAMIVTPDATEEDLQNFSDKLHFSAITPEGRNTPILESYYIKHLNTDAIFVNCGTHDNLPIIEAVFNYKGVTYVVVGIWMYPEEVKIFLEELK